MARQRIDGVRLHYEELGAGAPIVCIHGAGGTALAWAAALEKLAARGRVIAYDRRGCGRSERPEPYERTSVAEPADDAAALIDALAAAPAVVVGRSYGGTVAAGRSSPSSAATGGSTRTLPRSPGGRWS
jgi:esterase